MKLERYILFTDGMIYKYNEHSDLFHYVNDETVNVHKQRIRQELVKISSDNILDLVEVGDLVEEKNGFALMRVELIQDDTFYSCTSMEYYITKTDVQNIYKKQPNGDYKKYEVESEK